VQTKALTAATLSVVSDVLAQTLTGASLSTLNLTSLRNQFLIGLLIRGPFVHYWYEILNHVFNKLGFSARDQKGLPCVLAKVALDQLVFSPPYNLLYFHAIGFLEGTPTAVVAEKIARDFVPLMIANWKVWPLINIVNFKFVPAKLQVLFGNFVAIFWMAYAIKMTAKK